MAAIPSGIYLRISDDREGRGLGVDRQLPPCQKLAKALGWKVVEVYRDNDVSAYSGRVRKEYQRMLTDIAAGRIKGVIAWHQDRLNRSPRELEHLIDILERNQCQVQMVTSGMLDLSTATGRAIARTIGTWSRYESEHKSERILLKMMELAEAGAPSGGGLHRPFGYENDRLTVVPAEAQVIKEAARRFLAGEGMSTICRDFNERGVLTTGGKLWRPIALAKILTSGRICGWREVPPQGAKRPTYGSEFLAEAQWPAIVERDVVEQIRAKLTDPSRKRKGRPMTWLLSGILVCDRCGSGMLGQPRENGTWRYACRKHSSGHSQNCGKTVVAGKAAEDEIRDRVQVVLGDGIVTRLRANSTGVDTSELSKGIRDDESKLEQLGTDYDDGIVTRGEWTKRRQRLVERIGTARSQLAVVTDTSALDGFDDPTTFPDVWEATKAAGKVDRLRLALQALVVEARVVSSRLAPGSPTFDPDRIRIQWRA
jgi:DNA invertase Pin-like site-specific DNA recombinase